MVARRGRRLGRRARRLPGELAGHRAPGHRNAITEPVIAPVRRVLKPVRAGRVSIDLAFTVVFIAVWILRAIALRSERAPRGTGPLRVTCRPPG